MRSVRLPLVVNYVYLHLRHRNYILTFPVVRPYVNSRPVSCGFRKPSQTAYLGFLDFDTSTNTRCRRNTHHRKKGNHAIDRTPLNARARSPKTHCRSRKFVRSSRACFYAERASQRCARSTMSLSSYASGYTGTQGPRARRESRARWDRPARPARRVLGESQGRG